MKGRTNNPIEIVPGFYQIRLPIPFRSLQGVFVYLARDGNENLLIDTGWNSEESYDALTDAFKQIDFSVSEIKNVLVSHLHPDHYGQTTKIKHEAVQSRMLMHEADAQNIRQVVQSREQFLEKLGDLLKMHGTPKQGIEEMTLSFTQSSIESPIQPDVRLKGGELLKVGDRFVFQVIATPGHTIGQICLYEKGGSNLFFSGDHVLPTITPNISLSPLYSGDPLGDYLNSLKILRPLKTSKVLPSHEFIFENLQKRIDEIEEHHRMRLLNAADVVNSRGRAISGYEVATKLLWHTGSWQKLSSREKRAAIMETLAHLEHLKLERKLVDVRDGEGKDERVNYLPLADC